MEGTADKDRPERLPILAAISLALALSITSAQARSAQERADRHHYVHYTPAARTVSNQAAAQPDTGFGPTAPGVSAILIDASSGSVISETGADTPRYPASLTKLMTLDLAFQALRDGRMTLDTLLPVSGHAASVEPVKLGLLPGSQIAVRDAILAMTTMSANDAATVLGEYLGGGSETRCGEMMTLRAHALGMAQTEFYNASGLPNPNQITTARDLSILARDIVVSYPQFQSFFEVQKFNLSGHIIYSNNQMLKLYPGTTGMKTGYTILARHNLVTSVMRNGKTLIGVVLHEPSWGQTYTQMTAMMDSGFGGTLPTQTQMIVASNQPPKVPLAVPSGPSLFPEADAATIRAVKPRTSQNGVQVAGWTAQIGVFSRKNKARSQAIAMQQQSGMGVARIAKVQIHGKVIWAAQLAGLTRTGAHAACTAMTAKGGTCKIIAPPVDHMASRDTSDG